MDVESKATNWNVVVKRYFAIRPVKLKDSKSILRGAATTHTVF